MKFIIWKKGKSVNRSTSSEEEMKWEREVDKKRRKISGSDGSMCCKGEREREKHMWMISKLLYQNKNKKEKKIYVYYS